MKTEYKIIVGAIIAGLCLWLIDSCVDYFFFHDGLWEEILITKLSGHELFMRSVMLITLVSFGALVSLLLANRKSAEEALRISEREFREMLEKANLAAVILNEQGKIHFINNYLLALTGWKKEEVLGNNWFDIFIDEPNKDEIKQVYNEAVSGNIELVAYYENEIVTKHGERRLIAWNNAILHDSKGNAIGVTSIGEDITERRQAEEDLRDNRGKLNAMLESIADQINMIDREFNIIWANKSCEDVFGPGIIGKKCYEVYHNRTEPCEYDRCIAARVFEDGQIHSHENQVTNRYGQIRHQLCTANVALRDQEGNPTAVIEVSRDITKRKEAEREIHNQKEFLENVIESLKYPFMVLDANDYTIKLTNSAVAKFGSVSKNTTCYELSHRNDMPCSGREHRCLVEEVKKTKEAVTVEHIHLDDEDRERIVEVHAHPVVDSQGNVVQVIEYSLDITERKQAEEERKKLEQEKTLILSSVLELITYQDKDLRIIWANRAAWESVGKTSQELRGRHCYEIWHQRQEPCMDCPVIKAYASGQAQEAEMSTPDGRSWLVRGYPVAGKDGELAGVVEVTQEITERKRAEEALLKSEHFTKSIVSSLGEGVVVYDSQLRYLLWNKFMEDLTGMSAEKVVGKYALDLFPHLREQGVDKHLERALSGKTVFAPATAYYVPGTKKKGWVLGVYSPHVDPDGKITGVVATIHDITELKKAEQALQISEERFRSLIEQAADAVVVHDFEGNIKIANRQACQMFGYTKDELLSKNISSFDPQVNRQDHRKNFWEKLRPNEHITIESVVHQKDGNKIPVEVRQGLIEIGSEKLVLGMARDISDRKEMEERERLRQVELVHMARLSTVGEMASAIAHELNQPLTAILALNAGAKRMMTSSGQSYSEEVIDAVNETANQAHRAGKIISRIRDFTRKKTPNRSLIDINEIITESLSFIEHELKNKQIRLEKSLTDNSKVYADPVQVEQVLLNLFRNALDAMDEIDASKRELTINTEQNDEKNLQIAVSDTGPGLKDGITNEIFQPFVTTKPNGLGIGLSICRTIIERHDGHLWFDDNHETGATFRFTLPIEREI